MKRLRPSLIAIALFIATNTVHGAITILGANGKDGILAPAPGSGPLNIDLGKAENLPWDSGAETGGRGVYDGEQWAVVFRYESVTIPAGVEVQFYNHPSRAPVVWLVQGDVVIDGVVNLNGSPASTVQFATPGPGGFRGGRPAIQVREGSGGFGIGGGSYLPNHSQNAAIGSHVERLGFEAAAYGDEAISFLIGGSGGAGTGTGHTGSAGGGAILIASQGEVRIHGYVLANAQGSDHTGSGSGGSIKIVSSRLTGTGYVQAHGQYFASRGRIRLETGEANNELNCFPDPSLAMIEPGEFSPFKLLAPKARVKAIGNLPAPSDPRANLGANPADVTLPNAGSATIMIETENFDPATGQVTLFITPTSGARRAAAASLKPGGAFAKAEWEVTVELPAGSYAMQVHAVTPP